MAIVSRTYTEDKYAYDVMTEVLFVLRKLRVVDLGVYSEIAQLYLFKSWALSIDM